MFYKAPKIHFSEQETNEYNKIFEEAVNGDGLIKYISSYPKHRFLIYISIYKNVVLHGSNNKNIQEFEPRRQTLYNGEYVDAVFATKDGIWPVFFAVLDKHKVNGNIRNGCISAKNGSKFYFFSISKESKLKDIWLNGMIYFLPTDNFYKTSNELISFDEWISRVSVSPIARVEVDVRDFYFYNKVTAHKSSESLIKTWIMYKWRSYSASNSKRTGNNR